MPNLALAQANSLDDPMEDKLSQAVRAEYAKCRDLDNPLSRFLCSCRVAAMQCDSPRRLEHRDWSTIEFWPSNDESEREVQFILLMEYDLLGDFDPKNKGIVLTCRKGTAELEIYLGSDLTKTDDMPKVSIGNKSHRPILNEEEGVFFLSFPKTKDVFQILNQEPDIKVNYADKAEAKRKLIFDTYGFSNVTEGWEKLCTPASS